MEYLFAFIIALFIVATAPKPQVTPPLVADNISVPTAEEGRAIPVLFGTRMIEGPNVVWSGDFEAVPRRG